MFGWRYVSHHFNRRSKRILALGFEHRLFKSGESWFDLTVGRSQWTWVHYPRYRNRRSDFRAGFAEAAAKPPVPVLRLSDVVIGYRDNSPVVLKNACPGCDDPEC
jgi:hypothetical protein